ncbi:DUF4260 family protein [Streptomyces niveus]|uniref:DUF4260 domain-containing protein n=2 Tax=Streptomyces niveus TaxID=193462 RepID=A0ABZ2AAQ4_STRNV|nr:DUF4260 family protein [Streptomyces niveus]EST22274.1 hypothetical protein M877_30245 [Streptomyces niveus NCIMB 11891]WTA58590.1 DUF4260 family protein [Streptomyces niveus]
MTHDATEGATRSSASRPVRTAWVVAFVLLLVFAVFEATKYGGWVLVAALAGAVAPDLSFLAGLSGGPHQHGQLPRRAVPLYNLLHRPVVPVVVMLGCLIPESPSVAVPVFNFGLAWLVHIAADRALGYGLRTPDGWQR